MRILNDNLKIIFLLFCSIVIGVFLWDKISLPYSNPNNVYGTLSIAKFNPLNNDLRFITFIFLTLGTFFLSIIYYKKNLNNFRDIFFFERKKYIFENNQNLNIIFTLFLFFIILEFLSMSFPLNEIDFFHEGERLSPAKNFLLNGKIWSGALFIHNAFVDLFAPVIGWSIFGKETIGSYRLFILILILFTKFVLLILSYKISVVSNLDKNTRIIYFCLIAVTTLQLTEYTFGNAGRYVSYRELPILLFLIFSLEVVLKQNKNHYAFLIGLLSSSSIIFLIDRGIYTNVLIVFLLLFFLLRKDLSLVISIILGMILSWIVLYWLVGANEFNSLIKDTFHYLSIKGFVDSYIYPAPFIEGKFFTTKGIILVTTSGLLTIYNLLIK